MGNLNLALVFAVTATVMHLGDGISHSFLSRIHPESQPFSTAIASWNVQTPSGSWIETQLRARIGERWTRWYDMGNWSSDRTGGHRHSVASQRDADGEVQTDTLVLAKPANAWQVQVEAHTGHGGALPLLTLVAVATGAAHYSVADERNSKSDVLVGRDLKVPERTQRVDESPDALAGGGDAWCSPTSVSMVMAYWAQRLHHPQWNVSTPAAADGTFDQSYHGCGNWPFNVAFASEHGLAGWVDRLSGLHEMEPFITADVPLIASIRVAPGELNGSPYKKTDGHLLVVRGFTSSGDVIANDPYGLPGHIRIVYKREQFERVWMNGSGGIVYVIAPPSVLKNLDPGAQSRR